MHLSVSLLSRDVKDRGDFAGVQVPPRGQPLSGCSIMPLICAKYMAAEGHGMEPWLGACRGGASVKYRVQVRSSASTRMHLLS